MVRLLEVELKSILNSQTCAKQVNARKIQTQAVSAYSSTVRTRTYQQRNPGEKKNRDCKNIESRNEKMEHRRRSCISVSRLCWHSMLEQGKQLQAGPDELLAGEDCVPHSELPVSVGARHQEMGWSRNKARQQAVAYSCTWTCDRLLILFVQRLVRFHCWVFWNATPLEQRHSYCHVCYMWECVCVCVCVHEWILMYTCTCIICVHLCFMDILGMDMCTNNPFPTRFGSLYL